MNRKIKFYSFFLGEIYIKKIIYDMKGVNILKKRYIIGIVLILMILTITLIVVFNDKDIVNVNEKSEINDKEYGDYENSDKSKNNSEDPSKVELIYAKGEAENILYIKDDYIEDNNNDIIEEPIKEEVFTVYFNYDGGENNIDSKKVKYNEEYGDLPIPIKKGYTFDGWYIDKEYGERVDSSSKNTIKSDHTLHARYIINNYTITYDYNYLNDNLYTKFSSKTSWNIKDFSLLKSDKTFKNEEVLKFKTNNEIIYNEDIILDESKTYTFSVYIKTNNEEELLIGYENDLMKINTNSLWQRYTKTFKPSNGKYNDFIFKLFNDLKEDNENVIQIYGLTLSEGDLNSKSVTKSYNESVVLDDNITREGYTFDGWYTSCDFKEKVTSPVIIEDKNKIYYAKWILNLYTLDLDLNGGIYDKDLKSKTFIQGYNTVKKLINPKSNYKITYNLNNSGATNTKNEDIVTRDFKGWTYDNNKLYSSDYYTFKGNMKLTATYENNIIVSLDKVLKDGYICSWNTKEDGTGKKYDSESKITIDGDITLYSICERNIKFVRPLNVGYVTSEYGNRIHPIYGSEKFHSGIDMSSSDRSIYPIADGVVAKTSYNSSMGNYIIIYHNIDGQNYTSAYYHLDEIYVKNNESVSSDTNIGKMGSTGLATGVHLHLTMYKGHLYSESSTMVNPREYLSFPSELYKSWNDKITYLS